MIAQIENVQKKPSESFFVGRYEAPWFERSLHFHPEFELVLITEGFGTRVIGKKQQAFREGDLVLLGGNIPHAWFSDASFFEANSKRRCSSVYIQFDRALLGSQFADLPEMKPISVLLSKAATGLVYNGGGDATLYRQIKALPDKKGLERLLSLISILDTFRKGSYEAVLSPQEMSERFIAQSERIKKVHMYVMKNFSNEIKVKDVADLAEMNVSAFCRYFKKRTQRTFSQYLKKVRVDFAQQLLINTNMSSGQIGLECGFNSIAYFNQCFKKESSMSPLAYRNKYKVH